MKLDRKRNSTSHTSTSISVSISTNHTNHADTLAIEKCDPDPETATGITMKGMKGGAIVQGGIAEIV